MNISWYYIALGPNSIILIYCYCYHSCCACCWRIEKTRKRTEPDSICILTKSFAAGQIGPAAKLSWTVSYYLDHSNQPLIISNLLLHGKTDLQSLTVHCWWFGLYWTPSMEVMRTVQLTIKLSFLCRTNHWIYCMVGKKLSDDPVMNHVADPITLSMICCGVAGVSSDSMMCSALLWQFTVERVVWCWLATLNFIWSLWAASLMVAQAVMVVHQSSGCCSCSWCSVKEEQPGVGVGVVQGA